jgi:hypothetical protein
VSYLSNGVDCAFSWLFLKLILAYYKGSGIRINDNVETNVANVFVHVFIRFAFEGLVQAIYGFDRPPLECSEDIRQMCVFSDPKTMLNELDVADAKIYIDVIILCVFFFVFRLMCYGVLRWRVKVK